MCVGGDDPQHFPRCHRLPWSTMGSAAWPGTAGADGGGGRQLSTASLPGKIPFHVAACDLSRRLCRRGVSSREQGRCCSWGAPSLPAPGKLQHLKNFKVGRVLPWAVGGSWPPEGTGLEASACPHPAGSTRAADGLGQPSLASLQVWGGWLWCQLQGGSVTQPACAFSCASPQPGLSLQPPPSRDV